MVCLLVQVVPLQQTALILPEHYPSFTLLRQALGAVQLGYEALSLLVPEVRQEASKPLFLTSTRFSALLCCAMLVPGRRARRHLGAWLLLTAFSLRSPTLASPV